MVKKRNRRNLTLLSDERVRDLADFYIKTRDFWQEQNPLPSIENHYMDMKKSGQNDFHKWLIKKREEQKTVKLKQNG